MIYLELFLSFFQIGLFSFGGGYAAMSLLQNQIVEVKHWLTLSDLADVITISQMAPGSIAVNAATFVGIQIAGLPGAIAAVIGCVLPSCIIVLVLAYVYFRYKGLSIIQGILSGLRPAVIAMIASAGLSLVILAFWGGNKVSSNVTDINFISVAIFFTAIIILQKSKINPIVVMLASGIIGLCVYPFF
jgi:chromate transporter